MTKINELLKKEELHPVFKHHRFEDKSAITGCILEKKDRTMVASGIAVCSNKDNFCRARGRELALGRAMAAYVKQLDLPSFKFVNANKNVATSIAVNYHKAVIYKEGLNK